MVTVCQQVLSVPRPSGVAGWHQAITFEDHDAGVDFRASSLSQVNHFRFDDRDGPILTITIDTPITRRIIHHAGKDRQECALCTASLTCTVSPVSKGCRRRLTITTRKRLNRLQYRVRSAGGNIHLHWLELPDHIESLGQIHHLRVEYNCDVIRINCLGSVIILFTIGTHHR